MIFVHFNSQSDFSVLNSTLKIEALVKLVKQHNMPAIALCDLYNMSGHVDFANICLENGIQPIHGATIRFEQDTHLTILAKNAVGYKNLLKLISLHYIDIETYNAKTNKFISLEELALYSEGLILLSRYTEGPILKFANKREITEKLNTLFKNHFYFEIFRDGSSTTHEQEYIDLAKEFSIPLLATNNIRYAKKEDQYIHDILICIQHNHKLNDIQRPTSDIHHYFKSEDEMRQLFSDLPSAIKNVEILRQRFSFFLENKDPELPKFAENEIELLKSKALEGLNERLLYVEDDSKKYFERLEYELKILIDKNFAGYFLIVADFIGWAKENGIVVGPGRGSGAGSLVAWALKITDLDPIFFGLMFERFLNPERFSMPDFDIDLCQSRREEVITYVKKKYGNAHVAQIITFGTMQAKAVIRDVSRILGLFFAQSNQLTKLIPFSAVKAVTLQQAIQEIPELNAIYNFDGNDETKKLMREVLQVSLKLEGLIRNYSTHAAGVIISKTPLIEKTAIYEDDGKNIIQLSYVSAEKIGLIKFDFLGLQNLTVIDNCIKAIKKNKNIDIKFHNSNLSDSKTFLLLAKGLGTGIFQFESKGMQNYLRNIEPSEMNDLIALTSLYRPGPLDNIPDYIDRKHGRKEVEYMHPLLEGCLKNTYGIMIYQEQVMESARILSGYSLAQADTLRRAMGKKKPEEMQVQKSKFIEGALKNNISKEQSEEIFNQIEKFAGYGFNKSHAAAYSVISYYTAYLKAHYPIYFFVSCLNLELNDTDRIMILVQDIKNFGITLEPVDINKSKSKFAIIDERRISYSLAAIKGMNVTTGDLIEAEVINNGPFTGLINFIDRMPKQYFSKKNIEALIKAGAFDSIEKMNQMTMLKYLEDIQRYIVKLHEDKNQMSLFTEFKTNYISYANDGNFNMLELAQNEFFAIGLYVKYHPLMYYDDIISRMNIKNYRHIMYLPDGYHDMQIAATILKKDNKFSKGSQFVVLTISDQTSVFEISVFQEDIIPKLLDVQETMLFTVTVHKYNDNTRINISDAVNINSIEKLKEYMTENLVLKVTTSNAKNLADFLKDKKVGLANIFIVVEDHFMKYKLKLKKSFYLTHAEVEMLKSTFK